MSLLTALPKLVDRKAKRVGRGIGSGKGGHTAGRGTKGQLSRNGGKAALWFEGGQLPLIKRMPMWRGKGRFNIVRPTAEISLTELNHLPAGVVTLDTLKLENVIDGRFKKAKIVATGDVTKKFTIQGIRTSAAAKKAIESAGGVVED